MTNKPVLSYQRSQPRGRAEPITFAVALSILAVDAAFFALCRLRGTSLDERSVAALLMALAAGAAATTIIGWLIGERRRLGVFVSALVCATTLFSVGYLVRRTTITIRQRPGIKCAPPFQTPRASLAAPTTRR